MNERCKECRVSIPRRWRAISRILGVPNARIRAIAQKARSNKHVCWSAIRIMPGCVWNYPFEVCLNPNTKESEFYPWVELEPVGCVDYFYDDDED